MQFRLPSCVVWRCTLRLPEQVSFPVWRTAKSNSTNPRIIQHSVFFMFYPNFCGHFLTFNSTFLIYPFNFWLLFGAQTSFFANTEIKIVIEQFRTSFLTANDFDRLKITQTHKKLFRDEYCIRCHRIFTNYKILYVWCFRWPMISPFCMFLYFICVDFGSVCVWPKGGGCGV